MCGIFAIINNDSQAPLEAINASFMKGKGRGPEFSTLQRYYKLLLGFHRLAINGLNNESNQPLVINDIVLVCNGEIYNYKELYDLMQIKPTTESDCEVIIHLYLKYGIEQTLTMLDGEFSFVLLDNRITNSLRNNLYIARDPYGVRPLYCLRHRDYNNIIKGFSSEMKTLIDISTMNFSKFNIEQFIPGTYSVLQLSSMVHSNWVSIKDNVPYFIPTFSYTLSDKKYNVHHVNIYENVSYHLNNAVTKRCLATERPIACLLSGGLDSSLVTALANNFVKKNYLGTKLETYSIGLAGSEDLKYARLVADYLGTNHTEIIVTETEMFDAIPEVIYAIESYDTTTVRASLGNYLLGKYISKHSNAKVILNGDGSDELCGSYLYMNKCPDNIEFDKETRRLLKDIHLFDVLRSDKSISSHGLEPRTPFLDRTFVNSYLSIPVFFRNHNNETNIEKHVLRTSFSIENFKDFEGKQLLPDEILWRKKEAFSDGVTSKGRSLYQILQHYITLHLNIEISDVKLRHVANIDTEKYYYKKLFLEFFPDCESILPYYWMPKFTSATDPSARTLDIYESTEKKAL
jgi:asparagine synthase (glutamine-hydrolysing)